LETLRPLTDPESAGFGASLAFPKLEAGVGRHEKVGDVLMPATDPFESDSRRLLLEFDTRASIQQNEGCGLLGSVPVRFNITVPVARDDVAPMSTRSRDDLSYSTGEWRWPFD